MKKPRRDKGLTIIGPRDLKALEWIAEQYVATLDQVQTLLGQEPGRETKAEGCLSTSAARQVIARWRKLGYVEQEKLLTSSPTWVWLTREGLLQLGGRYQFYTPRLGALAHLHAINTVRLYMESQRTADRWKSERTLRAEQPQYASGEGAPHLPDAELWTSRGTFAIEVELTMKEHSRLLHILCELASNYYTVLYFASASSFAAVETAKGQLAQEVQLKLQIYHLEKVNGYNQIAG